MKQLISIFLTILVLITVYSNYKEEYYIIPKELYTDLKDSQNI